MHGGYGVYKSNSDANNSKLEKESLAPNEVLLILPGQ